MSLRHVSHQRMPVAVLVLLVCNSSAIKTLAIVDSHEMQLTHSAFFSSLRARGHELTIMEAHDPELLLKHHGTFYFDNLILFCPTVEEFGGSVDVNSILQFVDSGRNLLMAAAAEVSETVSEVAAESGIIIDSERRTLIDHHHFDHSDFEGDHTLLLASNFGKIPPILGAHPVPPVLFEGSALRIDQDNALAFGVLFGSATSYVGQTETPVVAGQVTAGGSTGNILVAALQARNNARMVVSGSIELFSDGFSDQPVAENGQRALLSGNSHFTTLLSQWCFAEQGRLRASQVVLSTVSGEVGMPAELCIKDLLNFEIKLEEWIAQTQQWQPYVANDVQLELNLLDTKLRLLLRADQAGSYTAKFSLPNKPGAYQLKVNYWRRGYSAVEVVNPLTVRPFRHDEYDRLLLVATPYYASSFAMMAGTFVFGCFLLHCKPKMR